MGTRSRIAIQRPECIISSYVHFDGYVTGVGGTLLRHYPDENDARAVADAGYLSALEASLSDSRDQTVEHNRDVKPVASIDRESLIEAADASWAEYVYLWDGEWLVYSYHKPDAGWLRLADEHAAVLNGEGTDA